LTGGIELKGKPGFFWMATAAAAQTPEPAMEQTSAACLNLDSEINNACSCCRRFGDEWSKSTGTIQRRA